jgi:hypothetical protein
MDSIPYIETKDDKNFEQMTWLVYINRFKTDQIRLFAFKMSMLKVVVFSALLSVALAAVFQTTLTKVESLRQKLVNEGEIGLIKKFLYKSNSNLFT